MLSKNETVKMGLRGNEAVTGDQWPVTGNFETEKMGVLLVRRERWDEISTIMRNSVKYALHFTNQEPSEICFALHDSRTQWNMLRISRVKNPVKYASNFRVKNSVKYALHYTIQEPSEICFAVSWHPQGVYLIFNGILPVVSIDSERKICGCVYPENG
jgi:hypothetical protein